MGYKLRDQLKLTIGGNNMTNEYLDQQDDLTEAGNIGMLSKWDLVVHIITLDWILTFKHSHIY
ncbi:hypothetical protein [Aquimarina sp. Aq107]|uniref:hypothetical protein n=1 Tax=Aquimarina sp. Aq107 TaxID=1191912 RepID=UPI000D559B90